MGELTCHTAARAVFALGLHKGQHKTCAALILHCSSLQKKPGQMFLILKNYWAVLIPLLCAVAGRYLSIKAPISGSVQFCLSMGSCSRFLGGCLMAVGKEGQTGGGVSSAGCWPQGNQPIPPCAEPPCCSEPEHISRLWAGNWI